MNIDNLSKAVSLQGELRLWREARKRCDPGIFKSATLRVMDAAHGHQGQVAETVIQIPAGEIIGFADAQMARVEDELRALGVEV